MTGDAQRRGRRGSIAGGAVTVVFAAGVSISCAAVVVLSAATGAPWPGALLIGLAALVVLSYAAAILLRRRRVRRASPLGVLAGPVQGPLVLALLATLVSASWLLPVRPSVDPATEVAGLRFIDRPDGTRLAAHVTRASGATQPPLVFVHGGPGVADMAGDVTALAGLAENRDVWVYDQIGSGRSSRLEDVTGYTTTRAVADLHAVVRMTGARQVALLGHSWGARVVTVYLARHPERVAAAVLSSPGATPVGEQVAPAPEDPSARLDPVQRMRLYVQAARPRNLFLYALTVTAPEVAQDASTDDELDARFAHIYGLTRPGLFCDPDVAERASAASVGHFANQMPTPRPQDVSVVPGDVADLDVPVLVIRPECDYVPDEAAESNVRALPGARLERLPGAGHQAYLERPKEYRTLVDDFLDAAPGSVPA